MKQLKTLLSYHAWALSALIALLPVMASCDDDFESETLPSNENVSTDAPEGPLRTPAEAVEIASNAVSILEHENVSSRSAGRQIDLSKTVEVIGSIPRSRNTPSDTLMYVVNYADDMGFAIIAAPKNMPELIAVTEKGHFNSDEEIENPGFKLYLEYAIEYATFMKNQDDHIPASRTEHVILPPHKPIMDEKVIIDTLTSNRVPKRVFLNWGQGDTSIQSKPYNSECPIYDSNGKRYVVGCGPLAIAMALSLFQVPEVINLDYDERDTNAVEIHWSTICEKTAHYNYNTCCPTSPYPVHKRLAQLLRQIGSWCEAKYGPETGVSTDKIKHVLERKIQRNYPSIQISSYQDFKYQSLSDALRNSPTERNVAIVVGENPTTGTGHAWLCDGCWNYIVKYQHYFKQGEFADWKFGYEEYGPRISLQYFNWGFDGQYNGYYADFDWPSDKHTYSKNLKFLTITQKSS